MPEKHTENLSVTGQSDGYIAISVHRLYQSGMEYQATLFILPNDVEAFAMALENFRACGHQYTLTLSDNAQLRIFVNDYYTHLNMEIIRSKGMPYDGYDTFSMTYQSLPNLISKAQSIDSRKTQ